MASDLFRSIEEFVNRPRDPSVKERVSKFVTRARAKGWITDEAVLDIKGDREPEDQGGKRFEWDPIHVFFAPVGYRPLFEQEVIFLLNEGLDYEGILKMPVPLRKKLIDKKLELKTGRRRTAVDELSSIPPAFLEQMRLSSRADRKDSSTIPQETR